MESNKKKPVQHLVLDTGAIIANTNLHNIAEKFYAPPDVPEELKCSKSKIHFDNLPFEVIIREPSPSSIKEAIDESKKTGDYQSLSIADIKVIALTKELHQEYVRSEPLKALVDEECEQVSAELSKKVDQLNIDQSIEDDETSSSEEESDDEGWITEDNIGDALKKLGGFEVEEGLVVGCITTDFALQNVLLSMNLGLVSLSGYRIKKIKSFVLRCRACYNTTSIMTKEFCSFCGHKMLHKCAVSVDDNGEQVLHLNFNRLMNKRGMQYSLAAPKGGKHAVNEQLFEDQPMAHMRMAKSRTRSLADGPFSVHDVTSRSAVLGVRTLNNKQKTHKNRNEARRGGRRK